MRLRDQEAFAAVVRRHGPMVLGVCRRVLRNPADADDAFQAAFLVLARKAGTLTARHLLAQWLHGVAYNTARKLRRSNTRRAGRERPLAGAPDPPAPAPDRPDDALAVLDDELNRLPERYRAVIVLCDLEGLTRKEAAKALACPEGTVGGRLARARALLAARVTARGAAPAVGWVAALGGGGAGAVPPAMVAGVVRAVGVDGLAQAASRGLISSRVADTTEGVLRSMFATQVRTAAAALCCGLALACAVGGIHFANAQPEPTPVPLLMDDPGSKLQVKLWEGENTAPGAAPAAVAPKRATVLPLRLLDSTAAAAALAKRFDAKRATITPLPDDRALLVYADAKTTKEIEAALALLGEPKPKQATAFRLDQKADCAGTARALAEAFGKDRGTFVAVPGDHVLLVYASEVDTATAQKLLAKVLAAEPANGPEPVLKTVVLETVVLRHRTAEEVAKALQKLLAPRHVQFVFLKDHYQLILLGPSDDVALAVKLAEGMDRPVPPGPPGVLRTLGVPELEELNPPPVDPGVDPHMVLPEAKQRALGRDNVPRPTIDPENPTRLIKKYAFRMDNVPWGDVLDWYAKESGLTLAPTTEPKGTFTFAPKADRRFTLGEVTDIINEGLMPQKLLLVRSNATLRLHPLGGKIGPVLVDRIEPEALPLRGRTEIVEAAVPLRGLDAGDVGGEIRNLLSPFGQVVFAKGQTLIIRDSVGNLLRIIQTLDAIDKPGDRLAPPGWDPRFGHADPRGAAPIDPKVRLPEAKTFTFRFKDAAWGDVLDWYAKESGLALVTAVKPEGTFTFTPPNRDQRFTLAEVTDIINDALLAEKWLLVRRHMTFFVAPADEPVDPVLVPRIALDQLPALGRTELVQVIIPVPVGAADELAAEVKKRLGPFGMVSPIASKNGLLVQDTAGKIREVQAVLAGAREPAPKK